MVGDYYLDLWRNNMQNKEIEEIYDIYNPDYIPDTDEVEENIPEKYYEKLVSAQKLLDINPEIIGFMTIPTVDGEPIVKLPVMQAADNSKYLNINAKGNESRAGALFLDYRNNFDRVENHHLAVKNSDNLVVYGHNMAAPRRVLQVERVKSWSPYSTSILFVRIVLLFASFTKL